MYEPKTRNTASSDGGSDTSGVEKVHSTFVHSPPIRGSSGIRLGAESILGPHFDTIYDAKLRSQARLLQNCWLRFTNGLEN